MNIVKIKKLIALGLISNLFILPQFVDAQISSSLGDNFELHSEGEVLGDNDFPTDPWLSFGVTVMDPLRANRKGANGGERGASLVVNWEKGNFAGILYQFSKTPKMLKSATLDIKSMQNTPGTVFKVQVIDGDGDIFKIKRSFNIKSASAYGSYIFDFNVLDLVKDGGRGNGKIDLRNVKMIQLIFVNTKGGGKETLYVDNFTITTR